jgi:hypothetical protein
MNFSDIAFALVLILCLVSSLIGIADIKSAYINPARLTSRCPSWWPYSDSWWKKWVRAMPLSPIVFFIGILASAILEYGNKSNDIVKNLILILAFIFAIGFILMVFIAITGRPKFLIPRHLR